MRPALALLLVSGTATAAPIAQAAADLDGDGTPEAIELDASGELRIGTQKLALGKVRQAKLAVSQFRGAPIVVVDTGVEAVLVIKVQGRWHDTVRVGIGGAGLDGDFGYAVAATPQGVYLYQTRPGAVRCDGKPAYLFAKGFNGTRFQPLSKLPIDIKEDAPVIAARLDPSPAPESLLIKARLASHQIGAADASALGIPTELDDANPATLWREEITGSAGEGQFFTYVPRFAGARAAQLRVVPGAQKGANRPQRLAVVSATGAWRIDLPDAQKDPPNSAYVADLPTPVEGCVTVIIESTYGPARGTTAIAELAVFAEGERAGGGDAALARVIAEGKDGATSAAQALARRGAAGVTALETELGRATDAAVRARLVRAALQIRDPAAGALVLRAIAQGWVGANDLVAAVTALRGLGAGAELANLALKAEVPLDARVAAVRALEVGNEKERNVLVSIAGRGAREVRHAVIVRLTDAPAATLIAAAQSQGSNAKAAGDLWRAVTRRAHSVPGERDATLAAMTAALPAATEYELRYRLVDGVAAIGDAAALKALAATLASYPLDESTAAYKQVAARAIAVNPRNEATDLLISFTRDREPGVRLAALAALTQASGTSAGPWHGDAGVDGIDRLIMTLLATDTWPEVRRNAAQALGARCARPGPVQALIAAIGKDEDVNVRLDALLGLVECKAAGASELLARLWDDGKAHLEVRRRAVDLTANLGDAALAQKLVGKFKQWRASAIESEAALALAQSAAIAVGRTAPSGAAEALVGALEDSAFPEIVAAAATGLGLLGPACTVAAKRRLTELAASEEEAQVVSAAKRAAQLCGKR